MKAPTKIGLTGGIGAGKTTISQIFQSLEIPIFNSDDCGKKLLQSDTNIQTQIVNAFGKSILKKNQIQVQELSKIIFTNKKKLALINSIIHPRVILEFTNWLKKQTSNYIIKESALLFEAKTHQTLDKIILVTAPLKTRIKRVQKRDGKTENEIKKIIEQQVKTKDIIANVDYVIDNNGKTLLTPKIIELHNEFKTL